MWEGPHAHTCPTPIPSLFHGYPRNKIWMWSGNRAHQGSTAWSLYAEFLLHICHTLLSCEEPGVKICIKFCSFVITRCCCIHTVVCFIGTPVRAGTNYFRLVRPLCARTCEQARGVCGHAPPGKCLKLGTLLLRPCLGQKKNTRIAVSVAREAIEPNCQK